MTVFWDRINSVLLFVGYLEPLSTLWVPGLFEIQITDIISVCVATASGLSPLQGYVTLFWLFYMVRILLSQRVLSPDIVECRGGSILGVTIMYHKRLHI